jgi:hypothetical protein
MRLVALTLWFAASVSAQAADLRLALFEEATKRTTYHSLNLETGKVASATDATGPSPATTSIFRIKDYKLEAVNGGPPLMEATEILAQVASAGFDVLVIRDEYNSFSNPLRWLFAMAGHPVQVSKILWVVVKDGRVLHRKELQREPASYQWSAQLFESSAPRLPQ